MYEPTDHDLLIRIDARTQQLEKRIDDHLQDVGVRLSIVENEVHGKGGLSSRMQATETKQKDNRNLIVALWVVTSGTIAAILTMFLNHVDAGKDSIAVFILWARRLI